MKRHILGYVAASLALSALSVGCKKEEPPPPLPTAQPAAAAPAPLQLKPEDAGVKVAADSGVKKKAVHGGTAHAGGLAPCCAALKQNATMQPDPMKTYMTQAATLCSNLAAQGKDKSALGMVTGLLRGMGMPSACQ